MRAATGNTFSREFDEVAAVVEQVHGRRAAATMAAASGAKRAGRRSHLRPSAACGSGPRATAPRTGGERGFAPLATGPGAPCTGGSAVGAPARVRMPPLYHHRPRAHSAQRARRRAHRLRLIDHYT